MNFLFTNVAYAANAASGESLDKFIQNVNKLIINPLIMLLFALALVYFVYGLVQFIANAENEEERSTGKKHMIWGVIGLTIMLGVWTLIAIITNTLGISSSDINPQTGTVDLKNYTPPPGSGLLNF